jgi:hypothetical protein
MAKRFALAALLAFVACTATAPGAAGKGLAASVLGATVPGLPYRYVAVAPNSPYRLDARDETPKFTVVGRIDKQGGRLGRWWYLPARYTIPAAAFDDTAGGLSADGSTLVLSRFSWIYPPRTTGLAIVHTERRPYNPPPGKGRSPTLIDKLSFPGSFSFDAISPDGSTVYLIEHLSKYYGGPYQVRALETKSGKLLPEPIVDPAEPMERMEGVPISRATSRDGRWAYTLYSANEQGEYEKAHEPFVHALDTVAGRAVCIDLPQLEGQDRFWLRLRVDSAGRRLEVFNRRQRHNGAKALLAVDTRSFEVQEPGPVATASSGVGPWPPIVALSAIAAALLAWVGVRHRRGTNGERQMDRR